MEKYFQMCYLKGSDSVPVVVVSVFEVLVLSRNLRQPFLQCLTKSMDNYIYNYLKLQKNFSNAKTKLSNQDDAYLKLLVSFRKFRVKIHHDIPRLILSGRENHETLLSFLSLR